MFPTVADVLTYLKGLRPQNLIGAAFGSYGWSGESVGQVRTALTAMGVEVVSLPGQEEALKVKYVPDEDALARCRSFGAAVAEKLKQIV